LLRCLDTVIGFRLRFWSLLVRVFHNFASDYLKVNDSKLSNGHSGKCDTPLRC